jgi:hypothetical protein
MLDCLAKVWRQVGQKSRPLLAHGQHLASFVDLQLAVLVTLRNLNSFEEFPDISLMDRPQLLLEPAVLLYN